MSPFVPLFSAFLLMLTHKASLLQFATKLHCNMDVRMIAHDLRTPLSALSFSIRNAKNAGNAEELRRALDIAERNATALFAIVEALIDTSAIERGTLSLQECLPIDLVKSAISQVEPQAEMRRVRIMIGEFTVPPSIVADCTRIVRVLVNLLSNAVRFSPQGGQIKVDAKLRQNDGHPVVVFTVSDEGPGVIPENIDRIFREGVSIAKGGQYSSGLGLAVCKELVEAHGGRIWIEPTKKGATFSFSIP